MFKLKRLMQIKELQLQIATEDLQVQTAILKTNTLILYKLNQISEQLAYEALKDMQIKAKRKR
jgi:hypothetical protein